MADTHPRADPPEHGVVEVLRSEEVLAASTQWQRARSVRVAKRIVEEEETITVTVRREVLVVEELPTEDEGGAGGPALSESEEPPMAGSGPVLTLVLSHEVVEPQVRVVPDEVVRVHVDRVRGVRQVSAEVAHEQVDVVDAPLLEEGGAGRS